MSAVGSICVVGGGFAGRALAKWLMHDCSLTVVSRSLYHLSDQSLLDNALGRQLAEEISLRRHRDVYELVEQPAVQLGRSSDGSFEVLTADGRRRTFDHLVLAAGCRLDPRFASLAQELKTNVYSTVNQLQALRLRANWDRVRQGKLVIASAGTGTKNVFAAASFAFLATEPNFFYFGSQERPQSVDLYIADKLLLPSDPLESLRLTRLLEDRGVRLHFSHTLLSVDRQHNSAVFAAAQPAGSSEQTVPFDSLLVDPRVEPDELLVEPVDPATLATKSGVYVAGQRLRGPFALMSEESVEAQAEHIANRLLGKDTQSRYQHSSKFRVYNTCTRSFIMKFDAHDKLVYNSLEFHHDLHHKLRHSLDAFLDYVWSPSRTQL